MFDTECSIDIKYNNIGVNENRDSENFIFLLFSSIYISYYFHKTPNPIKLGTSVLP